jgi:integrase
MPAFRDDRDGRWRYRKWVTLPDGSRTRIKGTPALDNKTAAEAAERAHITRLLAPGAKRKEVPTFDTFADEFMRTYVKANNRPSSVKEKEVILKYHLRPAFGHLPIDAVTVREVEELKAKLLDAKKAPKTVNNVLAVLRKLLNYAGEVGSMEAAPRVKQVKVPPQKFDFFTFEEYPRLLGGAHPEPEWEAAILAAGDAGLRMGEIKALAWDDVDLKAATLTVQHSDWQGQLGPPKGNRARTIPLTDKLAAAFKAIRHLRGPWVFCTLDGERWTHNIMRVGLWRACRRAGLRRIGWHVLRHTFCSHLAMRGASPKAIQELAGHTTLAVTLRYMHLAPGVLKDAIGLLSGHGRATGEVPAGKTEEPTAT